MKNFGILCAVAALAAAASCSSARKLHNIQAGSMSADISLPASRGIASPAGLPEEEPTRDTLRVVDFEGHETLIMNAVRDADGEMVATDRITASYVTARFRNIAERHGRVDLEFEVRVPRDMMDSEWQIRLDPDMFILGDSLRLDPVIVTGEGYRKAQLRGYQQYRRFLDSIITDSTVFINMHDLEIFIKRNLPELYAFKTDSSYVSDEQFSSAWGVTGHEALEHYTNRAAVRRNLRRIGMKDKMFARYVKAPIVTEGIKLDTVIRTADGDFVYNYIQTVNTRPQLRKVDIVLSGGIWEQDRRIYVCPRSEPLTFYISSLAGLVDNTEHYRTRIISRRVEANTACYIEFPQGSSVIDPQLGANPEEIGRIRENIRGLLDNRTFELDSILITAHASPEGAVTVNEQLCLKRASAAGEYFRRYAGHVADSLEREEGVFMNLDGSNARSRRAAPISFRSRSGGENWTMLDILVRDDPDLFPASKEFYAGTAQLPGGPDAREAALSRHASYRHLRESLYPRLRTVKFDFFLHRKGMVQDTVHTTELDSTYMRGVQLIRDRDYKAALELLLPYRDYNTAVAFLALDRNASAAEILNTLPADARTCYLLAVVCSRMGDERGAVERYLHACAQDPSLVHRGNLDPEISALVRKYGLNNREE